MLTIRWDKEILSNKRAKTRSAPFSEKIPDPGQSTRGDPKKRDSYLTLQRDMEGPVTGSLMDLKVVFTHWYVLDLNYEVWNYSLSEVIVYTNYFIICAFGTI